MMLPARARLRKALDAVTFHAPEVPVVANVDARVHTDPAEWPGLLSAQLCSPVRWRQSLESLSGRAPRRSSSSVPGGCSPAWPGGPSPTFRRVSVAVPDDLDKLMDTWPAPTTWPPAPPAHQGEHLYTSERVVVSPAPGVFEPDAALAALDGAAWPRPPPRPAAAPAPTRVTARRGRPGRHGRAHRCPHPLRRDPRPLAGRPRGAGGRGSARGVDPDRPADRDPRSGHPTARGRRRRGDGPGGPGHRRLPGDRPGLRPVVPGPR